MTVPLREVGRGRLRRQRLLALLLLAGALALVVVLLYTVGPFAVHHGRPGKPPLGYLRKPLGGRHYRVSAWTLGSVTSLDAATSAPAIDEVDFDWYHAQADGGVTADNENLNLVAPAMPWLKAPSAIAVLVTVAKMFRLCSRAAATRFRFSLSAVTPPSACAWYQSKSTSSIAGALVAASSDVTLPSVHALTR